MTQEIIEMARQAGLLPEKNNVVYQHSMFEHYIKTFAKLVAKAAKEQEYEDLIRIIEANVAAEREAIIDLVAFYGGPVDLEAAIRARGQS